MSLLLRILPQGKMLDSTLKAKSKYEPVRWEKISFQAVPWRKWRVTSAKKSRIDTNKTRRDKSDTTKAHCGKETERRLRRRGILPWRRMLPPGRTDGLQVKVYDAEMAALAWAACDALKFVESHPQIQHVHFLADSMAVSIFDPKLAAGRTNMSGHIEIWSTNEAMTLMHAKHAAKWTAAWEKTPPSGRFGPKTVSHGGGTESVLHGDREGTLAKFLEQFGAFTKTGQPQHETGPLPPENKEDDLESSAGSEGGYGGRGTKIDNHAADTATCTARRKSLDSIILA
ncbi:hypothetical protein B0H11DRAFT_1934613 [Mycena galericulata]|nr:hypothetical protein B0H11DRAFT_1934613 [Mycena galericulata]